jgi:hypothetical protein
MAFEPPPDLFLNLRARFLSGYGVEVAHHRGKRMRAHDAADDVMRVAHIGDPVAHRFIGGVLQSLRTARHGNDARAEQLHAKDVERLTLRVFLAHVNVALETEARCDSGGRHAVLTGARFSDDARLAHTPGEQRLPQRVVDFMRAGMQQIFALEVNFRAAEVLRQTLGVKERRRAPGEVAQQSGKLVAKSRVLLGFLVHAFQFAQSHHNGFWHELAAIRPEVARHWCSELRVNGVVGGFA